MQLIRRTILGGWKRADALPEGVDKQGQRDLKGGKGERRGERRAESLSGNDHLGKKGKMDKAGVSWEVALCEEIKAGEEKLIAQVGARSIGEDGRYTMLGEMVLRGAKGEIANVSIGSLGVQALIADLLA